MNPAWVRCPHCENYWCLIHDRHAYECDCPPLEEWEIDPYSEGGPGQADHEGAG